jgi:hypothetical protein
VECPSSGRGIKFGLCFNRVRVRVATKRSVICFVIVVLYSGGAGHTRHANLTQLRNKLRYSVLSNAPVSEQHIISGDQLAHLRRKADDGAAK